MLRISQIAIFRHQFSQFIEAQIHSGEEQNSTVSQSSPKRFLME